MRRKVRFVDRNALQSDASLFHFMVKFGQQQIADRHDSLHCFFEYNGDQANGTPPGLVDLVQDLATIS
jgi:hypothetical protein